MSLPQVKGAPGGARGGQGAPGVLPSPPPPVTVEPEEASGPGGPSRPRLRAVVHDQHQIEVRCKYDVGSSAAPQRLTVEAHVFVPRNVGVHAGNYSRAQFYGDVTSMMRLHAPPLPPRLLADPAGASSPLRALAEALAGLRDSPRPPPTSGVIAHARLFAFLFAEGVRGEGKRLRRAARRVVPGDAAARAAFLEDLDDALGGMDEALRAFRWMREAFRPYEALAHRGLPDAFASADEFMSLSLEEALARLVGDFEEIGAWEDSDLSARVEARVAALARAEAGYRLRRGYLTLDGAEADPEVGEYCTYRSSLLKKTVHQALYLDPREAPGDRLTRNATAAVGAALAAIWAFALATQIPPNVTGLPARTQIAFFMAAVGAYVLKDRIKALTHEYLYRRLRRFDHTFWVSGASVAAVGLGALRARVRESMGFRAEDLPEDVRDLRFAQRTVGHADVGEEEVIAYVKQMELRSRPDGDGILDDCRLLDILRLNVRHFLVRLDDPMDDVRYFDRATGLFVRARLPKVYHLNLVIRLRHEVAGAPGWEQLHRLRVVLNQGGIVRMEKLDRLAPTPLPPAHAREFPAVLRG
ncbi:hypothetical protein L6R50_19585 [Myxococcota bacterium]|nr:hypothetical protein [Myxococcota bacterium]